MKRFFTISALVLIGLSALACGPWIRPNYYIFSAFNRDSMYGPFDDRLNQFWADYVGKDAIESWSMDNLVWTDLDKFNESTNPIIVKAIKSRDTEMQQYMLTNGWSKEYRDLFLAVQKNGIYRRDAIFPIYLKMQGGADTQAKQDTIYMYYLCAVGEFGCEEHCYSDTASIRRQMYRNDSIMRAKHVEAYGDTVYAYMFEKVSFSLDSFPKWIDTLRKYPEPKQAPSVKKQKQFIRPFGISYNQWWSDTVNEAAYEYQAKTELGYFDLRFDLLVDDAADAAGFNELWKEKAGCKMDLEKPFYRSLTFNPALYNETMTATRNATTPIVLIYGQDDAWTGAAVKDEFINGVNVHKFILPAQNHNVHFTSNTDRAMCEQIRTILDGVLGAPHGIEPVTEPSLPVTRKVMRDGKIVILRNGETYDLTGRKVR